MKGGTYEIEIVLHGYEPWKRTIEVPENPGVRAELLRPGEVRSPSDRPEGTVVAAALASPDATSAKEAEPRKLTRKEKRALRRQEKAALMVQEEQIGEESMELEADSGKQKRSLGSKMWTVTKYAVTFVAVVVVADILDIISEPDEF